MKRRPVILQRLVEKHNTKGRAVYGVPLDELTVGELRALLIEMDNKYISILTRKKT